MHAVLREAERRRIRSATLPAVCSFVALWFLLPHNVRWLPAATDAHYAMLIGVGVIAVCACILAGRETIRHERGAWLLMGLGALFMVAGDVLAGFTGGVLRQPLTDATSLPGLLWVAAYVPYLSAFGLFLQGSKRGRLARIRRSIELVLLVLLVTLALYTLVLYPLYGQGAERPLTSTLLFFVSLAVSLSLLLHIGSTRPRIRAWHLPLICALIVVCLGSLMDTYGIIAGVAFGRLGGTAGLAWYLGYSLVAIAAFERIRLKDTVARNVSVVTGTLGPAWGTALSAAAFLLLPLFVYVDSIWRGDALGDLSFSLLISAAAVTAIGRNLVIAIENSSLRRRATTDPLTGLYNHRHFHERLDGEVRRAERTGNSLSVVTMDVDFFDRVNNVYGHSAGDRRLRSIADRLVTASRSTDIVCRVGGDEFTIIMPDTDPLDAYKVCFRLQDYLHEPDGVCPLPISLSIGIASLPEHAHTAEDLVTRSDGALYWAKFHGREQIVIYDATLVRALGPEERIARLEEESYVNMVQLLSSAVDARDPYTHRHSRRVAELCVGLAHHIGLTEDAIASLETAALLHDVGKIGVPDAILRKPDRLSDAERELVNEHPSLATRILTAIPRREILPWVAAHHEHWDGTGYPRGLAGENIPLMARIISLCDAYDAMTSDRPYRAGLSPEGACAEIVRCAGTQFDPTLAEHFVEMIESDVLEAVS